MATTGKTILILGGGVGGLAAANALRKRLPRYHRVVLVERGMTFVFAPSLLWLLVGNRSAAQISRPLSRLVRPGVAVVAGDVQRIDPERLEVTVDGRTMSGDILVIALGTEAVPESIPGLVAGGHNLYALNGAEAFRDAFARFRGGRLTVLTATPAYRCPAAPYEATMLVEAACRRRGIREATDIHLFAAEPGPMGVAGPEVSRAVRQMVESRGVTYHPEHQLSAVDADARRLRFATGAEAAYDLLAYVPPQRAPRVVRESGLGGEGGWIAVNRQTLETRHPHVYAIGDVNTIPLKMGKPLPKAGVFAHLQAEVVAKNVAFTLTGRGRATSFNGDGECFIETGDHKAGFGKGNFFAEPSPEVRVYPPALRWHVGKILLEQAWLRGWI